MEEMTLSTKEFLLAAANLGAKNFFGISDPFYGMTVEEIQSECQNLQCSLEKKGYATVDFEGSFELTPEAASLISSCIKCRSYLLVQLGEAGKSTRQFLAYAGRERFGRSRCSRAGDFSEANGRSVCGPKRAGEHTAAGFRQRRKKQSCGEAGRFGAGAESGG